VTRRTDNAGIVLLRICASLFVTEGYIARMLLAKSAKKNGLKNVSGMEARPAEAGHVGCQPVRLRGSGFRFRKFYIGR
jgi:hypothetical protein